MCESWQASNVCGCVRVRMRVLMFSVLKLLKTNLIASFFLENNEFLLEGSTKRSRNVSSIENTFYR